MPQFFGAAAPPDPLSCCNGCWAGDQSRCCRCIAARCVAAVPPGCLRPCAQRWPATAWSSR